MKKKIILILSMVALLVVILAFSVSATSVTYISEGFVGNTVNQNVYADLSYVNYGNDSNKNFNIICVQLSDTGSYIFIVDNVEAFQYRFSGYSFVDVVSEIYGTTDEDFDYYRNGFSNLASCTDAIEYFLNWSAPYSAEDFFNELDSLRNSFDGELSRDAFNTYVENNAGAQFISLYFGKLNVFLNTFYFSGFEDFSKLLDTVYTEFKSSSPDDLSGQAFNEYVSSLLSDEFHYFAFYYTNGANTFADNMYNAGVTLSSGLDISDGSFDISDSELTDTDYDNLNVPSCLVCNSSGTCEHFAAGYKNGYHDALFSDKNKENLQNAFDQGKEYACTNGVYQNFVNAAMETSIISFNLLNI